MKRWQCQVPECKNGPAAVCFWCIRRQALEDAAAVADEHAEMYPPDIFTSPPQTIDGASGVAARWKAKQIAMEIRDLDSTRTKEPGEK